MPVGIIEDNDVEGTESFFASLNVPGSTTNINLDPNRAEIEILDDDGTSQIHLNCLIWLCTHILQYLRKTSIYSANFRLSGQSIFDKEIFFSVQL